MQKQILAVVALAAAGSVGACGSDSGGSSGGTNVPLTDVPAKLAAAVCGVVDQCLGSFYKLFLNGQDCVTLNQRQVEQGDFSRVQAAIDAGTVTYHGDKVDACLTAIQAKGCDLFANRLPSECQAVFDGTVAAGGDCTINEECAGDNVCQFSGSTCPGKCQPRAGAGSACNVDDDCQDTLTCQSQKCTAPAKDGASCGGASPDCLLGLYCAGYDAKNGTPGKCTPLATAFSAKPGEACDTKLCALGSACEVGFDGTKLTYTCVAPVASGAACKPAVPSECPQGEYCNVPKSTPPTLDGTCTPVPAAGSDCGSTGGANFCAAYSSCDATTNKCVAVQNDGGSCADDSFCYSKHCVNGTCQAGLCTQ